MSGPYILHTYIIAKACYYLLFNVIKNPKVYKLKAMISELKTDLENQLHMVLSILMLIYLWPTLFKLSMESPRIYTKSMEIIV